MPNDNLPAVQNGGVPSLSADELALMQQASADAEAFSIRQVIVPYLFIVQGASDYVKRGTAKFIQGCAEGDIMDSLMLQPMQSALVIPCKYEDHSTEWRPNQGGMVRQYFTDHTKYHASQKKGATDFDGMPRITAEGNEITLVPTYYCLLVNEAGYGRPVVLPMASTQAKKSRRWNGLIDALQFAGPDGQPMTAPIYAQAFKLTTVPEKGRDNTTFSGWKIEPAGLTLKMPTGRRLWEQAQAVRKQVEEGVMKMAEPTERDISNEASATTDDRPRRAQRAPDAATTDEDIPF